MTKYNPKDWYWVVAGSATQVYSSVQKTYVPVSNAAYQAWLAQGNTPTGQGWNMSEAELFDVLAEQAPDSLLNTTEGIAARRANMVKKLETDKVGKILLSSFLNHENRIRALEKKVPITREQLIEALKELL